MGGVIDRRYMEQSKLLRTVVGDRYRVEGFRKTDPRDEFLQYSFLTEVCAMGVLEDRVFGRDLAGLAGGCRGFCEGVVPECEFEEENGRLFSGAG